jgi:signal transduction histidine kinase
MQKAVQYVLFSATVPTMRLCWRTLIGNLLSNAAKFSPAGADVLIRVVHGMTHMRVEVQDSGPGIAEEFKRHLFEKFTQADASATRRFEGTGLGLSIARGLVESMGGTIGFTSVVGQGSTFFFELQRWMSPPSESRETPNDPTLLNGTM